VAGGGTVLGTVVRWDDARSGGVVEAPDLPGDCWVPAEVVSGGGALRAGQVVDVDWTEPGTAGFPCRATRAVRRGDLQATPGA
jgi:CspA family cold shock protein